ncbi:U32 family peptidase [Desulfovibrio sp. OttesenSCG-928-C06]|nr:U32 family peptidase [Desulfovibrio sp. OttesenSCG-928-C06]
MRTNNSTMKLPEILAPAGNFDKFRTAIQYGATAVYLGGENGNLRAASCGLSKNELKQAVKLAEAKGASLFYCLNSFPFENDLNALPAVIEEAAECGVHAFIIADPGLLRLLRKYAPRHPVHLSTQSNTTNSEAVKFWLDQGVCRVNLARELDYRQIHSIRQNCPEAELEVFVHGAMCLAVSGQCLLSAWLNKRPANQGQCTQPCRFEYKALETAVSAKQDSGSACNPNSIELTVEEALRPGKALWQVEQNEGYSAFWAPDDLCLLPYLPWFIHTGATTLKIEGRTKSASYVAHVADVYSSALKAAAVIAGQAAPDSAVHPQDLSFDYLPYLAELLQNSSRQLTSGFFLPEERVDICRMAANAGLEHTPGKQSSVLARFVEPASPDATSWIIDVKENWNAETPAELMLPGMKRPLLQSGSYALENHRGESSSQVSCGTRAVLHLGSEAAEQLANIEPGIFIRRRG